MNKQNTSNAATQERAQGTSYLIILGAIIVLAEAVNLSSWVWTQLH